MLLMMVADAPRPAATAEPEPTWFTEILSLCVMLSHWQFYLFGVDMGESSGDMNGVGVAGAGRGSVGLGVGEADA
jgi:hypothetical protein